MTEQPEAATPDGAETIRLLSLVERTVTQRLDDALRAVGSGIDQWRVLSLLAERGGCPMHVVADHALLLAPRLSKLVDRMVSANLVLRRADDHDRRRVLVFASARGRQALAEWDAVAADVTRQFRDAVGADAALLDDALRRLSHELAGGAVPAAVPD
ncbi:MarR family transcriptional regulator [Pseudonocardia sp. KRD-184]|uniref:MarR family transcriptional regulator n=1 Tax=Pseudonocardia oceani TaxID=2792013 RepID=A0ABS6U8X8_9PSEU|nr:MarR family winged helix-turn-helix transcriptional regulator [Pseudonocardia oceani]MBW0092147.1 MarR family transcriptional regulator [Pseudonocardia oceani]MBW0098021.1 MarR family transcriptional regulator [Pseudonocardia oceani]MBW0111628.1 MarR family transcriptional regulator [Pseudonocardia oceani]MBW0124011.1 MarR family transcriptional regulator [Pseudonocardia oceani]MBW0128697.1 MarR family transcriptional regulator [Pseudonocardia oceani]